MIAASAAARDRYKVLGRLLEWLAEHLGVEVLVGLSVVLLVGGGYIYLRSAHQRMKGD